MLCRPGCFFFVVAPFCSCPASLVSRKFFAVGPGCAKCFFFFVALRWAPRPFGGARAKNKHHPGCFCFCSGPGERQGKEKPRAGTGPEQKTKHHPGFFFLLRPRRKAREGEAPLGAGTGPEQKKNTTLGAFPRGRSKKKHPGWCSFFALAPCRHGASPSPAFPRGRSQKKKHPGWCFFFCCGHAQPLTHSLRAWVAMPPPRPGWCFFFCCGPARTGVVFFFCRGPARTLTHSLWAGAISARPGWCFFFLLRPRPDRGGVLFLLWPRPDAHSLTVGWGDFGKARVVFFFLLRPRRVFLDNNKNVWGTTSGLKRPGEATAKKKHHFLLCHHEIDHINPKDEMNCKRV